MEKRIANTDVANKQPLMASMRTGDGESVKVFSQSPKHSQPLAYALVKALIPGLVSSEELAKVFETGYISVPSDAVTGDDLRRKVIDEEYAELNKVLFERRKDFMYEYPCPEAIVDDMIKKLQADKFKVTTKPTPSPREATERAVRTLVIKW